MSRRADATPAARRAPTLARVALTLALGALPSALSAADPSPAARVLANAVQPLLTPEHAGEARAALAAYRGPDEALVERLRGDAAFLAADHVAAIAAYRAALALPDPPAGTRLNLARALAASGDPRTAAAEFAAALDGGRAEGAGVGDLAAWTRALIAADEPRAALLALGEARLRHPDDVALAQLELAVLAATGDWDALAGAATARLARAGDDRDAWRALIAARRARATDEPARDELAAAVVAARRAGAIDARAAAVELRGAGLIAAAAAAWRDALAGPIDDDARLAAVDALLDAADGAGAAAALAGLAPAVRTTASARRAAARIAIARGDRAAARAELESLIADGQADGAALLWAARLAEGAGDGAAAIDRYQRAALDPATARGARLGLALALARAGRRDEALAAARTAVADDPADGAARGVLEWIEAR